MKLLPYLAVFLAGTIGSVLYWQNGPSAVPPRTAVARRVAPIIPPKLATKNSQPKPVDSATDLLALPYRSRKEHLQNANTVRILIQPPATIARQIAWDPDQLVLIFPDGKMQPTPWEKIQSLATSSQSFTRKTIPVMRQELQQEFGPRYQVSHSHDFVVVQPIGSRQNWSTRMQQFLGNVQSYFSARRFPMSTSKFPMVAIVLPNRAAFEAYAASHGDQISDHYLAYYSLMSNRVVLYETAKANQQLATVFHEAFHQIAFNSEIHYRTASPPRFIAEGMATAFEAPGMYDHRRSGNRSDRLHPVYHRLLPRYLKSATLSRDLETLLLKDNAFEVDPTKAYCLSWAVCFYLMEFHPQKFSRYLQQAHSDEPFSEYSPPRRAADFAPLAPRGFVDLANQLKQFYGS